MPKQTSTFKACAWIAFLGLIAAITLAHVLKHSRPTASICSAPGFCEVFIASMTSR